MMKDIVKRRVAVICTGFMMTTSAEAIGDFSAGIGFMERSDTGYGFIRGNGVFFENDVVRQKVGLEFVGYKDGLDRSLGTDLRYTTFVVNYEVEYKASKFVSLFVGAGGGFQRVELDSPVGGLDDDLYGYAQVFGGLRVKVSPDSSVHLGVRRMFFDDYDLLGVSSIKQEQTWGVELGFSFTF